MNLQVRGEALIVSDITQSQRKTGYSRLSVFDHDRSGDRSIDKEEIRQMSSDFKSS